MNLRNANCCNGGGFKPLTSKIIFSNSFVIVQSSPYVRHRGFFCIP